MKQVVQKCAIPLIKRITKSFEALRSILKLNEFKSNFGLVILISISDFNMNF